ncbi:hypothetical protein JK358_31305 [Nocardia sp. 2]|uniref:Uncharacterized protein n=1 Tax=Nocardia acididurans TaxID=2802282 RepID=A0ABS1ME29_9NOCA|nr:hypothetical protein [Nocardia acididurans]MBL1078901.1 hypothetical protein [Nocardia acididurans]
MRLWNRAIRCVAAGVLMVCATACGPLASLFDPAFQPSWISFISDDEGWARGTWNDCASDCSVLLHTTDGGLSWQESALPPVDADRLVFADSRNWFATHRPSRSESLYAELWSTHDGGVTWSRVELPFGTRLTQRVVEPVIESGSVQVPVFDTRTGVVRILGSPVETDDFTLSEPFGIGVTSDHPSADLALAMVRAGTATWFGVSGIAPNRPASPAAGARLIDGRWATWPLPCRSPNLPDLVAVSPTELVASCAISDQPGSSAGEYHLYSSADGGDTFADLGALARYGWTAKLVGAATARDLVVLVPTDDDDEPYEVRTSHDGGHTWTTTLSPKAPAGMTSTQFLGHGKFFTPTVGFVQLQFAGQAPDAEDRLYWTRDGGDSWSRFDIDRATVTQLAP